MVSPPELHDYRRRLLGARGALDAIVFSSTILQIAITELFVQAFFVGFPSLIPEIMALLEALMLVSALNALGVWLRWRPARWLQPLVWVCWSLCMAAAIAPRCHCLNDLSALMVPAIVVVSAYLVAADSVRGRLAFRLPVSDAALALDHRIMYGR